MKAFTTNNGNIIFNNGTEMCYLVDKKIIVENKSSFTTVQAIANGCASVEFNLDEILEFQTKMQNEKQRISEIKSQIKPLVAQKLSIKEKNVIKNKVKKDAENGSTYFTGTLTVTDSSRRTGGYFKYSDNNYDGIFEILNNEIYNENGNCLVSSRKKNFTKNFKEFSSIEFAKAKISNIEEKLTASYLIEAKKFNAELMVNNVDIFRNELLNILTK